jgi:poly-D-alanine transfer protein DltD
VASNNDRYEQSTADALNVELQNAIEHSSSI